MPRKPSALEGKRFYRRTQVGSQLAGPVMSPPKCIQEGKNHVIKEEGENIRHLPVFTWPMSVPGPLVSHLCKKTQEATEKDVEEK